MYTTGSVAGPALTFPLDVSPIPPLIITLLQKVRNLASISTIIVFEPPSFRNGIRYLKNLFKLGVSRRLDSVLLKLVQIAQFGQKYKSERRHSLNQKLLLPQN